MKTKLRLLINASLLFLAVSFTACEGDQGEIGPKGDTGTSGSTGATGANGANGTNGTGFDELTQFGNIEMTFSGTVNEDEEYSETVDFIYMPITGVSENSTVYTYDDDLDFILGRENKGPAVNKSGRTKDGYKNNISIGMVNSDGVVQIYEMQLYTDILLDNFKTFEIDYYNSVWNDEAFVPVVTNYSYNSTTGKLIFDFSYTIPAINNATGHDIELTGKADLTVFENIGMLN